MPGPFEPPRAPRLQHGRSPLLLTFLGVAAGILVASLVIPVRQHTRTVVVDGTSGLAAVEPSAPATSAGSAGGASRTATPPVDDATDRAAHEGDVAAPLVADPATATPETSPVEPGPVVSPTSGTSPSPQGTPTGASATTPAVAVQGVTDTEIHLGIGIPDLGVLAALGPNYDFGDPQRHVEALLAGWREQGRLPVHGRDIVPHYRRYDIVGTEQQRAACKGWALDDEVFAVMAVNQFWAAAPCVTTEHGLPLVTTMSYYEETHRAGGELVVDLQMSTERVLRNFARWGHDNGHFADKRLGIYYATGTDGRPIREAFIPTMEEFGYAFTVEMTTDNHATGSSTDQVAAQRFAADDVEVALLFVSGINQTNFMQQAQLQGYRPSYLVTDIISSTNDTATSTYPPEQYDGSFGLTQLRYGEEAAGLGTNPQAAACRDNYAAHGGERIEYRQRPAEWLMLISSCDVGEVLLQALERAGPTLTIPGFMDEIYSTTDLQLGLHSPVTLRRGVLGGTSAMRPLQWRGNCRCFHATGDFDSTYGN